MFFTFPLNSFDVLLLLSFPSNQNKKKWVQVFFFMWCLFSVAIVWRFFSSSSYYIWVNFRFVDEIKNKLDFVFRVSAVLEIVGKNHKQKPIDEVMSWIKNHIYKPIAETKASPHSICRRFFLCEYIVSLSFSFSFGFIKLVWIFSASFTQKPQLVTKFSKYRWMCTHKTVEYYCTKFMIGACTWIYINNDKMQKQMRVKETR